MRRRIRKDKVIISKLLFYSGVTGLMLRAQARKYKNRYIRLLNYHDTVDKAQFESQLNFYKKHFVPASPEELSQFLKLGTWKHKKPGLILTFDDGVRSNHEIAKPLLEKHGFVGWFFVPSDFADLPPEQQYEYAIKHRIYMEDRSAKERVSMSWNELLELSKSHIIGCHTKSHQRLHKSLTKEECRLEIVDSKKKLEDKLGRKIDSFCWVGGEDESYSKQAAQVVEEANYEFGFMTVPSVVLENTSRLQLHRTNVESHWPVELAAFQVSGFLDLLHRNRLSQINQLTRPKLQK